MGFSIASAHIIFFIGVVAISAGVIVAFNAYIDETKGAMTDKKNFITDQLRTQIEIVNVRYSGGVNYIYTKNVGDRLMETDCINVFVDNKYISDSNLAVVNASSGEARDEWDVEETLEFRATESISPGSHTAKVVTCNGISDEYSYST
jgi:archaellum component FlaG (FlaF/FlaG flagellin family)